MEVCDVYIYICVHSLVHGMFRSRAHLQITLTLRDKQHISCGQSSPDYHTHCGTKGNKLKRKREREREARQYQSEDAGLEVRIIKIIAKQPIIPIWST